MTIDNIEDAVRARSGDSWPAPDGREALRAALVKQADGSYVNVLGIDDESFFTTLDKIRTEFRYPEALDFGNEGHCIGVAHVRCDAQRPPLLGH